MFIQEKDYSRGEYVDLSIAPLDLKNPEDEKALMELAASLLVFYNKNLSYDFITPPQVDNVPFANLVHRYNASGPEVKSRLKRILKTFRAHKAS